MKRSTTCLKGALATVLFGSTLLTSPMTLACVQNAYIGSICITAANFCPQGYVDAAGQLLTVSGNQTLYSVLGNAYGGKPPTTFALPNMGGRTPVGVGQGPGLSPVIAGEQRGQETSSLTTANLAAHNHGATLSSTALQVSIPVSSNNAGAQNTPDSAHSYLAGAGAGPAQATIWSDTMNQATTIAGVTVSGNGAVTVGNTGNGQAFSNLPPQLGLRYCIAVVGPYPPHP